MIQKSYMRFLGTLTGTLIAAVTLTLFDSNNIAVAIVISLSAMLFSYLATGQKNYSELGTLGAVTVVIILISHNPTIAVAAGRFLEISIGILIAALISQLILPIHARRNLRNNQTRTIRQLQEFYKVALLSEKDNTARFQTLDEDIVKSLIAQRKLETEAVREPFGKAYNVRLFKQSLWCEKEIIRCIMFMHHAYEASPTFEKMLSNIPALTQFNEAVCHALEQIAEILEKKISATTITLPDIQSLKEAMNAIIKILEPDDIIYAETFLFCADILTKRIKKLHELANQLN